MNEGALWKPAPENTLERVVILSLEKAPKAVALSTPAGDKPLSFTFADAILTIRNPQVKITSDFGITLTF